MGNVTVIIEEVQEVVTITVGETTEDETTEVVNVAITEVSENVTVTVQEGESANLSVTLEAGQNISTGRVVVVQDGKAWYFNPSNSAHAGRAYGITTTSGTTGENVTVVPSGRVQDAAFSFGENTALWVGANGVIFDTVQSGTLIQKAGISLGGDAMQIDFSIQLKRL